MANILSNSEDWGLTGVAYIIKKKEVQYTKLKEFYNQGILRNLRGKHLSALINFYRQFNHGCIKYLYGSTMDV